MKIIKFLIIFLLFVGNFQCKSHNRQENLFDKEFAKKKTACEKSPCGFLPAHFNDNCVNQCISKKCYEQSFFNSGLEPGEIDQRRFYF